MKDKFNILIGKFCIMAFVYSDDYAKYSFGFNHPLKSERWMLTKKLLEYYGFFNRALRIIDAKKASVDDLLMIHTLEYIDFVKRMSEKGFGYLSLDINDEIFHSDSLFSTICHNFIREYGEKEIDKFIQNFPKITSLFYGIKINKDK